MVAKENAIDDIANEKLDGPTHIHVVLVWEAFDVFDTVLGRDANLLFHSILAHAKVAENMKCRTTFLFPSVAL